MLAFRRLFALASLAAIAAAQCENPKLVSKGSLNGVDIETLECAPSAVEKRTTDPSATSVCGQTCSFSCFADAGDLPPINSDCVTINNAVQIFSGKSSATFSVLPNHIQTLRFGTCAYYFQNLGQQSLTYCWSDLAAQANASAIACFPPAAPATSDATCRDNVNGLWLVGARHA